MKYKHSLLTRLDRRLSCTICARTFFSQGLIFCFDCSELVIMFIFALWFRPWKIFFRLSLEIVDENCKMEEGGLFLHSEFITKRSNRKDNAYWNFRAFIICWCWYCHEVESDKSLIKYLHDWISWEKRWWWHFYLHLCVIQTEEGFAFDFFFPLCRCRIDFSVFLSEEFIFWKR